MLVISAKELLRRLNYRVLSLYEGRRKPLLLGGARQELIDRILLEERRLLEDLLPLLGMKDPEQSGTTGTVVSNEESGTNEDDDGVSLSDSESESGTIGESNYGDDDVNADTSEYGDAIFTEGGNVAVVGDLAAIGGPRELIALRCCFGFEGFRDTQEWAIGRCLRGLNSLLVLPTGSGKSICYQLPALLMRGLTIVISPLIALMQDQMKKLPVCLPGACLSGPLTALEMNSITSNVFSGHIKVLIVSPERVCTNAFRNFMRIVNSNNFCTQGVSLLCVDEAHCMSSWSYNFRPAFLRIRKEIATIQPRAILALTATAPPSVRQDIMMHLGIDKEGLKAVSCVRNNLTLRARIVGSDGERRIAAQKLLQESSIAAKIPSTIVYVWRRSDAESYSESFKSAGIKCAPYHAGMDSESRRKTQQLFDRSTIDVITATTSFGMGVDKADVRRVLHCCLPKSVEAYLQETGRAGRDSMEGTCEMIVTREDFITQSSLSHSSRISTMQLFLLLWCCFPDVKGSESEGVHLAPDSILNCQNLERTLDLSSSSCETIVSILELPPFCLLTVDDIGLDSAKGQLSCSDPGDDILLRAIFECNRATSLLNAGVKEANPARLFGNYDKCAFDLAESEIENGFNMRRAYLIDFDVSMFELMKITKLGRDEITRGFYQLQKAGNLRQYSFHDNCIYAALCTTQCAEFINYTTYIKWLWRLTIQVQDRLKHIEDCEVLRIANMWKLVNHLDPCSGAAECNAPPEIDIPQLLERYLRNEPDSESNDEILSAGSESGEPVFGGSNALVGTSYTIFYFSIEPSS